MNSDIIQHEGEYVTIETLVLDKQSQMIEVEQYKRQLIDDVQPIFADAHANAAGDEERQAAIIQQWESYQVMVNDLGTITAGMLEAVQVLKEQRDVEVHNHEALLEEIRYATFRHREGENPTSHDELERVYSGDVSALIQAVDHAAHGHYAEDYASFRSTTAQSIMADLAALIAGQSDHIPYPVAKNLFAYLTGKGLSTDERNQAAAALRRWADVMEVK